VVLMDAVFDFSELLGCPADLIGAAVAFDD
jgi:hypothetical protein